MRRFFETNLPSISPAYLLGQDIRRNFEDAVASIAFRSQLLNEALDISGMEANKFHAVAKSVFDLSSERFDMMTAEELASVCRTLDDGLPCLSREEWPNAVVLFDTAFTTTKEWESLRHIGIGGSESSVVMECSPYSTKRQLYHDKVGTPKAAPESGNNPVFDRGHMTESKIVDVFCKLTGAEHVPESRMFASRKYPNSTANIDAIIRMPNGNLYVFEAKTTKEENRKAWLNDKVPRNYLTQTRQYPAVLDDERIAGTYISCMFVVDYDVDDLFIACTFDGNKNITHFVERDRSAEEDILMAEQEFWDDHIIPGIEPEPGDPELELRLMEELFGPADPVTDFISLDEQDASDVEEWIRLDSERKALEAKAKAIKEQQDEIKVKFAGILGTEIEGRLGISDQEYYEVRYAPVKAQCKLDKKTLEAGFPEAFARYANYDAMRLEFPAAYAACVRTEPGERRFSIRKKSVKPSAMKKR